MELQNALLWEVTPVEFILVTVVLAGAAAWMTGRSVANTWGSNLILAFYLVLLTAATRFIHFALFHGSLLSVHYFIVDLAVLAAIGFAAKRYTRTGQMTSQYRFRYRRAGPFNWSGK